MNTRGFGRIAARVSVLTFLAQGFSFASSIVIAHVLGASRSTDAYFLGLSIPTLVYGIFLAAVRLGAIPALTEEAAEGEDSFATASNALVSATLVVTVGLSLLAAGIAIALLPLTESSGLVARAQVDALELTPLGVMGAMIAALASILAVRNRFSAAALVLAFDPILRIVLLLVAGSSLGVHALVMANLAGNAIAVIVMWMLVRREGIPLRLGRPRRTAFVSRMLRVSTPLLICQIVVQINPVIDRAMAGTLGPGAITSLELGLRMFAIPMTLIGATLIGPLTATWSARKAVGGWPALRDSVNRAVETFVMVLPPLLVLGIALHSQLVSAMYQGGAYSQHATRETGTVFVMLLVGLPAQLITIAFATLFVVEKQTKFVLKTGIINALLNVVLNLALRPGLGAGGIALSTSLTYTIVLIIYVVAARRRWEGVRIPLSGSHRLAALIGIGVMAGAAFALSSSFSSGAGRARLIGELAGVAVVVFAVYGATLLSMGRGRRFVPGRLGRARARAVFALPREEAPGS